MKRTLNAYLMLLLLGSATFTLAIILQPRILHWNQRGQDSVLKVLLGDGRRIFAEQFFRKADVYFHSGYYPSIFDQAGAPRESGHLTGREEHHDEESDFRGPPRDCFERLGRNVLITKHTHLEGGNEREILPWLKLSAELDPQRVDTYTAAAYMLRGRLGKVGEAEQFLREGLRANPDSYEILFALGRLYYENYHDRERARNVWLLARRRWHEHEAANKKPDNRDLDVITVSLARLEEDAGNLGQAIGFLEEAKKVSPAPQALQKQIDELKQKVAASQPPKPHQP